MLDVEPIKSDDLSEKDAWTLREDQVGVVDAALEYICAERETGEAAFGRIVLPPRTGKTVIAAKIIGETGFNAVFLTPRKFLVDQVAAEFRDKLPGVPVWKLYGGLREVGDRGILVATYDSLEALAKKDELPGLLHRARLVFVDEAHHAMTHIKQGVLRSVFRADAVRIALTATPDYDEARVLARHFPDLIQEMTIHEGVQKNLLAPVRASVYEVDAGGSDVRIVFGDYDPRDIEAVMSRRPMLQALDEFRYAPELRELPALICCKTKQQAYTVFEYLAERSSEERPPAGLILGDLDDHSRQNILGMFEMGVIDTLITVGVLIEGWSSPRCKLLIDLAPGLSQVRAAQKYTRPMTKDGDNVARIIVLVPDGLREFPVLPLDVFGPGLEEALGEDPFAAFKPGERENSTPREASPWERLRSSGIGVRSVSVRLRLIEDAIVDRVNVRKGVQAVRALIYQYYFKRPDLSFAEYGRFLRTRFRIEGVTIQGRQLLRFLGFRSSPDGYRRFLLKYYPKAIADGILSLKGFEGDTRVTSSRNRLTIAMRGVGLSIPERFDPTQEQYADQSWLHEHEQPSGALEEVPSEGVWPFLRMSAETRSPEEILLKRSWDEELGRLLGTLTPMEVRVIRWRFGLDGEEELTLRQIGDKYNLGPARIHQIQENALAKFRRQIRE
ncbi:MAG: DEAD/DEAH box helicase family protein [Candidatus Uhrbacteria bacterium]|nr:DEAD/DEAH box helicase family protein [Candidatus Uhrbacteria bacterium]